MNMQQLYKYVKCISGLPKIREDSEAVCLDARAFYVTGCLYKIKLQNC